MATSDSNYSEIWEKFFLRIFEQFFFGEKFERKKMQMLLKREHKNGQFSAHHSSGKLSDILKNAFFLTFASSNVLKRLFVFAGVDNSIWLAGHN